MSKNTDIQIKKVSLYFIPIEMRVPLKFGSQVLTSVTCARVSIDVETTDGNTATGWGETPLSVGWAWPSSLDYEKRHEAMKEYCRILAKDVASFNEKGHPMELGEVIIKNVMDRSLDELNKKFSGQESMPHLAALICLSAFDIAIHDAYGQVHQKPVYETYQQDYMNHDLDHYLEAADGTSIDFKNKYPQDYFATRQSNLPVWHLVGGLDPVNEDELTGDEPDDGYPVLLRDWIKTDGLNCLKIKCRGNDADWDYQRIVDIGKISIEENLEWLTTDFNCTVTDPEYVNEILDRLKNDEPRIYGMILYVEQPFPYDLDANQIDVHSVSARKPLYMDESAHDWQYVKMGRQLGWNGVALKTCKTQTGALLSMCWAKAHGMGLMVQDLTNPMLAIIPHALLASYAGTIMGVECNAMQFYPSASSDEMKVHQGLYQRRNGIIDISTLGGFGFEYQLDKIEKNLPECESI